MIGDHSMRVPLFATCLAVVFSASAGAQDYDVQVSEMVTAIGKSMTAASKKSVAVLDFVDLNGRPVCLGQVLAEELSVGLVSSGQGFETVSRNDTRLRAVLNEQKLGASGIVDPQSAVRLGQVIGVQALVTGTITPIGDRVRVTLTVIDSMTARIVGGTATQIPRTRAIDEYLAPCTSNAASVASGLDAANRSGGIVAPGGGRAGGANADALFKQGMILWNGGSIAEAKKRFEAAVATDPNHAESHYQLGMIFVNEGNRRAAASHLETYLNLAPTGANSATAKGILATIK
jgi:TolB-like protein